MYLVPTLQEPVQILIAIKGGAYTTQAENDAHIAVLENHYGAKRGSAITFAVTIVALSIILGTTVDPLAYIGNVAVVIPLCVWVFSIRSRHQDLKAVQQLEYKKALEILALVTTYLEKLRADKITFICTSAKMTMVAAEKEYEQKNNYQAIVLLAREASSVIERHYSISREKGKSDPLLRFVRACEYMYGLSRGENIQVIEEEYNVFDLKTERKVITVQQHHSSSVIFGAH